MTCDRQSICTQIMHSHLQSRLWTSLIVFGGRKTKIKNCFKYFSHSFDSLRHAPCQCSFTARDRLEQHLCGRCSSLMSTAYRVSICTAGNTYSRPASSITYNEWGGEPVLNDARTLNPNKTKETRSFRICDSHEVLGPSSLCLLDYASGLLWQHSGLKLEVSPCVPQNQLGWAT